MSGTKNNLSFNDFSGYYNNLYHSDYGGFSWYNMVELNKSMLNILNYCDTGYNNVLQGRGEGVTVGNGSDMYTYATTFNLKSGTFASAWETNQPVYIDAWYNGTEKASIEVHLSQTATKIDFAKYGTDFQNINAIVIWPVNKGGTGGNTCTYGRATYGYQIAFDNLKITMNEGGTHHSERGRPGFLQAFGHHHAHIANPFAALQATNLQTHTAAADPSSHHESGQTGSGYHAELMSLDSMGHGDHPGLTSQFALPQVEHFGM